MCKATGRREGEGFVIPVMIATVWRNFLRADAVILVSKCMQNL